VEIDMTVIAVKAGVMACDGRVSQDDVILYTEKKILRAKSGLLIGCAGDCSDRDLQQRLIQIKTPEDIPSISHLNDMISERASVGYLLYFPDHQIWWIDKDEKESFEVVHITHKSFFAIGCGRREAMVAMELGCGAHRAVEMACRFNNNCGLPIHTEVLEVPKRKKKPAKRSKRSG
jgi:hypothetical protein